MSGTLLGYSTEQTSGLLPINTTLLAPNSGYFNLWSALWMLMCSIPGGVPIAEPLTAEVSLNQQISSLMDQIESLNQRLSDAGIP